MKLKDLQNTHLHWVLERWIHLVEQQSAHTKVKNAILKSCILTAVSWYWALFSKVHFLSRFGAQLLALQLVSGHGKHTIKQWLMNLCGLGAAVFKNSLSTLTSLQGHQYTAQDWEWKIRWECIIGAWAYSFKRKKKEALNFWFSSISMTSISWSPVSFMFFFMYNVQSFPEQKGVVYRKQNLPVKIIVFHHI